MKKVKMVLTDAEIELMTKLKSEKIKVKEIARIMGYNVSAIERFIKKHKVYTKEVSFSKEDLTTIEKLISDRVSQKDIASKFGVSVGKLQNVLKSSGIKTKLYEVVSNYFEIIDTEDKAYFLGLMYADGYNNISRKQIKLKLLTKDLHILKSFASHITTGVLPPITVEKGTNCSVLQVYSGKMCKDLERHGCGKAKAHTLRFPTFMSDELTRHFIRGYFDGDGSIFAVKQREREYLHVNFSGTYNFISQLQEKLLQYIDVTKTSVSVNSKNHSAFSNSKQEDILKIRSFLYDDCNPKLRLSRKYEKFQHLELFRSNSYDALSQVFLVVDSLGERKILTSSYLDVAKMLGVNIKLLYTAVSSGNLIQDRYTVTNFSKKQKYVIININTGEIHRTTNTIDELAVIVNDTSNNIIDRIQSNSVKNDVSIVMER